MNYWRMQLHPSKSAEAMRYAVESLAAGYIGLDFGRGEGIGDLGLLAKSSLPSDKQDYWAFAHEMRVGDRVLIIVHHFPFALVRVSGGYNHIHSTVPDLGIWFRHFRPVDRVQYYADRVTNARAWQRIAMTDTISPLRDPGSKSYQLIEQWMRAT